MEIPFLSLHHIHQKIRTEALAEITSVYDSMHYILGEKVKAFEHLYASFSNTKYCIGVGNGNDAIKISLMALEVKEGDEVIIPASTFYATLQAILEIKAKPILVDVDPFSGLMDLEKTKEAITSKTKVILPVHLYGYPVDMSTLSEIAQQNDIYLLEDNAQAHGAKWNHHPTGGIGDINATSFYPGKNLGAIGDGGAITTNNKDLYERCLKIRNYGSSEKYRHELLGVNSRLDELQAAFLSVKLKYITEWNKERNSLAQFYLKYLEDIEQIEILKPTSNSYAVYHLFTILCDERDRLQNYLKENGVATQIHYPIPIHLQEAAKDLGYKKGDFPISEKIAQKTLSLPMYISLSNIQIEYICLKIKEFFISQNQ
ncbi:DegT/DnrJ/EryC1/StrS family aminotransferase [Flammeovirga sp. SubArs3]|uniref:DegT/DnrJ/EryC1/StrS family aminotransferase n=1 Tax=Flammeovirga sp. SubArs3 TaxID=2995316 RepID=UPI00248CB9C0|nr:DegT/DnrJ/EryC1/StrS family aminotransferase [Flammeovirga sp. SubArs3]